MLSADKRRDSQRKSSLKGNGVREKKKDKEVREIWFNPHATEMRESQMDLCDCECQLLRDERVQRELQRLAKVYSQVDMEEEYEEEPQTEESQTKGCCGGSKNKKPKEKGSQSKQKSEKAATKSKNTKNEQPKSRDKKEMTRDKKDNSASRKSNGKEDSNENKERTQITIVHRNCRFKTREEAKRYKELKSIYTTHPRQRPSTVNNKKKEESQKGKQKGQKDLEKCPGSSSDESTHTQEETPATIHKARKDTEHTSRRPRPRPHSSSSDYPQESANRQRKKEGSKSKQKKKKSGGGCCGGRAKSDDEDDAYKPTRKSSDASSASNRHAVLPRECPWTSEELEQLAKLRATYTRDIAQKNMRKQVEQQAQPQPDKNDTGCCGSKKKKTSTNRG
ncbi:uncharacterized protein [Eurosta solidaginis]|uniref:uncharacterized protein n=1 Tax=Eurosta solidaginis TaxID=178769 RepID=UPI0035310ED9